MHLAPNSAESLDNAHHRRIWHLATSAAAALPFVRLAGVDFPAVTGSTLTPAAMCQPRAHMAPESADSLA